MTTGSLPPPRHHSRPGTFAFDCEGGLMYDTYRHLIREHVFDKCWQLDIAWAEVEQLVDTGEVIEDHDLGDEGVKEIKLLLDWKRPLHLVYVVNHEHELVVYRTIYEADDEHWLPGYRKRRR